MKAIFILMVLTEGSVTPHNAAQGGTGDKHGGYVPYSIHNTLQACNDAAYVLYENESVDSECHAIGTDLIVRCTTDSSCESFHGWPDDPHGMAHGEEAHGE